MIVHYLSVSIKAASSGLRPEPVLRVRWASHHLYESCELFLTSQFCSRITRLRPQRSVLFLWYARRQFWTLTDGQRICDTTEATPKLLPEGTYQISVFKCTKSKRQIPLIQFDGSQYYNGTPIPLKCERCAALADECERLRLSEYGKLKYAIEHGVPHPEVIALEKVLDEEVQKGRKKAIRNAHDAANCPKLLHGNGVFNRIDGSILVGIYRQPGVVINSRPIFDRLYDRIEKAISRGHQVELTIYNS